MSNCNHSRNDSWWENDRQGIPLARVCKKCVKEKLSGYRVEVLTEDQQTAVFGRIIITESAYDPCDDRVEADY